MLTTSKQQLAYRSANVNTMQASLGTLALLSLTAIVRAVQMRDVSHFHRCRFVFVQCW